MTASLSRSNSLVSTLRAWAQEQPSRRALTFLDEGELDGASLTFGELDRRARAVAAWLKERNAAGSPVLLLFAPGLDFAVAFLGCLYAGAIAVPAYPPDPSRLGRSLPRLLAIIEDARACVGIASQVVLQFVGALGESAPVNLGLEWLAVEDARDEWADASGEEVPRDSAIAFLQYTSGSTATPKGVMVSHGNLVANLEAIRAAFGTRGSVCVSWLPLYHDMGLIGTMLQPLREGGGGILMSPLEFLSRPVRWLQAISHFRATHSGGPDFAYALCARKVTAAEKESIDLSSWHVAFSGAEPVRQETLKAFATAFAQCGFRASSQRPCYGLAEATLLVAARRCQAEGEPAAASLDRKSLATGQVVMASPGSASACSVVSCGAPASGVRALIVDPATLAPCSAHQIGEVWIASPAVARGYWNRPEESAAALDARLPSTGEGPFLRSGDLGFMHDGELYITGRMKDLIIVRGVNHYPQDIERTVEQSHGALRRGGCAAFSVPGDDTERVVVVAEVGRGHETLLTSPPSGKPAAGGGTPSGEEVFESLRRAVAQEQELAVHAVVLLRAGELPKTSSGKLQRHQCRAAFLEGRFASVEGHVAQRTFPSASLVVSPGSVEPKRPGVGVPLRALLSGLGAEGAEQVLRNYLATRVAGLLRQGNALSTDVALGDLGLDSLAAADLHAQLEQELQLKIPMHLILANPSIASLAKSIAVTIPSPAVPRDLAPPVPDAPHSTETSE
jgi:acyl-CoA synthetase (AMP-forming)/AMP-acid ligase II/acyl carrier protein